MQHVDRAAILGEYDRAGLEFHRLASSMTPGEASDASIGTSWTNGELLYHMLFGYFVVRALLPMVRAFDRLPDSASDRFAALLNAGTRPFDAVNYWGSRLGSRVITGRRLHREWERASASLRGSLVSEGQDSLARSMGFPTKWDPFFRERMTLADVYAYPNQHFWFHRRQLNVPRLVSGEVVEAAR